MEYLWFGAAMVSLCFLSEKTQTVTAREFILTLTKSRSAVRVAYTDENQTCELVVGFIASGIAMGCMGPDLGDILGL